MAVRLDARSYTLWFNKDKASLLTISGRIKSIISVPEYPNSEDIEESEIHANHLEAKNSTLRRTNSAFRRRTNTYAKTVSGQT